MEIGKEKKNAEEEGRKRNEGRNQWEERRAEE